MSPILLALSLTQPAQAIGTVVGFGGSEPAVVWVRSIVAADPAGTDLTDAGVAVVSAQVMVDADDAPWAWLVPLPAGDRTELVRYQSDDFDRLFMASAPAFEAATSAHYTTSGCGGPATFQSFDTGMGNGSPIPMGVMWAEPDTDAPDRDRSWRAAAEEVPRVLDELAADGFSLSSEVHGALTAHAAGGGDLLVVTHAAPSDQTSAFTDVFAWSAAPDNPTLPLSLLSTQPGTEVLFDLHLAGSTAWAPLGIDHAPPRLPEVLLLAPSGALPYWHDRLLDAWKDGSVVHVYGGDRDDLEARSVDMAVALDTHSSVYEEMMSNTDSPLEAVLVTMVVMPFVIVGEAFAQAFEDLFSPPERDAQVDDLFRNLQIDALLPSGWRKDDKVHMAYQGVISTDSVVDLQLRADPDLKERHTVLGGTAHTSRSWLLPNVLGTLGLLALGWRRSRRDD